MGYYLEFDVARVNRDIHSWLGVRLPQPMIEVSATCCDFEDRQRPLHECGGSIDLRFATIMDDLALPQRNAHDELNDAVMAGLAFLKLRRLLSEP